MGCSCTMDNGVACQGWAHIAIWVNATLKKIVTTAKIHDPS